ncbi:MAG: transposase [Amphritea sp.]
MSYDALRKGRVSLPGYGYFITTVTDQRSPLFFDLALARITIREMRKIHNDGHLSSLAWVLMPDHLHWLIQLGDTENLSQVVGRFKANSARALNRARGCNYAVWQRGYYDRALRPNESELETARYIVANPLRAKLVEDIGQYPHWDAIWV